MQTFSFILRGFWAWIDSFWMPGVAPLLLFLNFPAVLAVPWHKSISCVGFSGDGWCCRGPGRGGVRPGVPQDRGSIQQHTRVIVASHKTKKNVESAQTCNICLNQEKEREKWGEKMISSPNWDLLLGGSELTEPFLPPFFLYVTLCSHTKIIPSFFKCCGSCDNWIGPVTYDLLPFHLACRLPWVSEGPHCEGIHSILVLVFTFFWFFWFYIIIFNHGTLWNISTYMKTFSDMTCSSL